MSNPKVSEAAALLARQAGLERALGLFPDAVQAAFERGSKPLGEPPGGAAPLTAPAAVFDPASFEQDQ